MNTPLKIFLALLIVVAGCESAGPGQHGSVNEVVQEVQHPATAIAKDPSLPHITVDRANRLVDLDAIVNLREGDWIELFACSPGSRTHESILVVWARPSHIHLALMMLGLNPGAPMNWVVEDGHVTTTLPHGPKVTVDLIVETDAGPTTVPANHWVVDQQTKQTLGDNVWLFTGSRMIEHDQQPEAVYRADIDGSIVSLVNFGDDVLAKPTDRTRDNDNGQWIPNTDAIPPVGTPVKIRVRAVGP